MGRHFSLVPYLPLCLILYGFCTEVRGAPGTTPNIREIFLGRCLDYQELGLGKSFDPEPKDCTDIWETFLSAWGHKDLKEVTMADYEEFFDLAKQTGIPENKTLLWSGTYKIAHAYADGGTRYVTLEDTLIGYLANGLTWCGVKCESCDGINYEECPDNQDLPKESRQAFWGGASATFAGLASGVVSIMVNGSDPNRPAFRPDSFMALFELPDLNKHVRLRVLLVNDLEGVPLEHCDTGSMVDMRSAIESHGFTYNCEENPEDILHLMCVDNMDDKRCFFPTKQQAEDRRQTYRLGGILNIPTTKATNDVVG